MPNILIRAKLEKIEHKMKGSKENPDWCWWTINGKPRKENIRKVQFTDGKKIIAEGKYLGVGEEEERPCILFAPLDKVNKKLKKKPPTRGFTYVD